MREIYPITQILLFLSLFLFLFNKIEIGKENILIVLYIIVASLSEVISYMTSLYRINNTWFGHIYYPIEFILFFFILLQWKNIYRKYWKMAGILVATVILIDCYFITSFSKFPVVSMSSQSFFFFLYSAWMLIEITTRNFIPFYKDERFYIISGIFIYSSLTSLMYLFYNLFNLLLPFYIAIFAGISTNLFFTGSMVLHFRQRKMLAEALN